MAADRGAFEVTCCIHGYKHTKKKGHCQRAGTTKAACAAAWTWGANDEGTKQLKRM